MDYTPLLQHEQEKTQFNLFEQALKEIKEQIPVMLELGSEYAYYSRRFNDFFNNKCLNFGVEILPERIEVSKNICPNAIILHGYAGKPVHIAENLPTFLGIEKVQRFFIKDILDTYNIKKISMLHMDIQGSEISVLEELNNNKLYDKLEWVFCSIHGTFNECIELINNATHNVEYIFQDPIHGGYGDGLIAFKVLQAK